MGDIKHAASNGYWLEYGIKSWTDLLFSTFGKVNKKRNKYQGKQAFESAKKNLRDFMRQNDRLPGCNDRNFTGIAYAANKGYWTDFGVSSWSELLIKTFGFNKTRNKSYSNSKKS